MVRYVDLRAYRRYYGLTYFRATMPPSAPRECMADKNFALTLRREGCTNRPFYHIVLTKTSYPVRWYIPAIEQVGTYDPFVNANGEKLVSLNIERIQHYLSQGVQIDTRVAQLLGLAGLLPQHPTTYQAAWRNRRELTRLELEKQSQSKTEEASKEEAKS